MIAGGFLVITVGGFFFTLSGWACSIVSGYSIGPWGLL